MDVIDQTIKNVIALKAQMYLKTNLFSKIIKNKC